MVKTPPIISIVMIMRNQTHWLLECSRRCFKSIKEHTVYPAYELIVVDSESTTKGWRELNKEFIKQGAVVVRSEKNLGFSGSFNAGLNLTSSQYVFFVENDVIVTNFWITNALRCFALYPECGLVRAVENTDLRDDSKEEEDYNQEERYKQIQNSNKVWLKQHIKNSPADLDKSSIDAWTSLWCFAIRKTMLKDIDNYLFDEKIGLAWDEDVDLCWRIRDTNYWKILTLNSMYVYHYAAQTCKLAGEYAASPEKEVGRRYFIKKHDIILCTHCGWQTRRKYRKQLEALGFTYVEYEDVHGKYIPGRGQRIVNPNIIKCD